jgi:hypothetical protein
MICLAVLHLVLSGMLLLPLLCVLEHCCCPVVVLVNCSNSRKSSSNISISSSGSHHSIDVLHTDDVVNVTAALSATVIT